MTWRSTRFIEAACLWLLAVLAPAGAAGAFEAPAVTLVDASGRAVDFAAVLDHEGPVLLQFIFTTCPTICPVMSATFGAVEDELAQETVRLVSISIDPEHDTPARLAEHGRKFGAGPSWWLLTGERQAIDAVQKAFAAYRPDKMEHAARFYFRAAPGQGWVVLDGLVKPSELVAEVRRRLGRAP